MNILILNTGSSSIKYKLYDMRLGEVTAAGLLERIGEQEGRLKHQWSSGGRLAERVVQQDVADHRGGLALIGDVMRDTGVLDDPGRLDGIGHRVVHGGETFRRPVVIDEAVIAAIRGMVALAPLHNPANLTGIEVAMSLAPGVPQVAVFDTAFHQTLPPQAYLYALPMDLYERFKVRRYGFHGTSHRYITRQAAKLLARDEDAVNLISLHLGNGASVTAIRGGSSVDTSMGMTPLEGLIMGTRCGDLDPSIPGYLQEWTGSTPQQVQEVLNRDSGMKGICGVSDMREVQRLADSGSQPAQLAIDMFCYRIRKYIGAYKAILGRVDALVFTGGIGENSPRIRAQCCLGLEPIGIELDEHRNRLPVEHTAEIQSTGSASRILVIRSDEELEIALQTMLLVDREPA